VPTAPVIANVISAKDVGDTMHCACGFNVNSNDLSQAMAQLQNNMGPADVVSLGWQNYTGIAGEAIAFVCQKDKSSQEASAIRRKDVAGSMVYIGESCGQSVPGTLSINYIGRYFGYMQYSPGLENSVCDSPDSAAATSCSPNKRSENRALPLPTTYNTSNVLDTRQSQDEHCLCGTTVEETSYNDAKAAMTADLNTGKFFTDSSGNFRHTVVKGDTVAFVCILINPGSANQPVLYGGPTEMGDFSIEVTRVQKKNPGKRC